MILGSCSEDGQLTEEQQLAKDIEAIDKYLSDNQIIAQQDPSGLRYVIEVEGAGLKPILSNTVVVEYTGMRFDRSIFDQTKNGPVSFKLSQLIEGWQIGFQLLSEGSKATLYIPSGLAYGMTGFGPIAPNTNLIFDVDLKEVK